MKKIILPFLIFILIITSCTTSENMTIRNGSTTSSTSLVIDDFFSLLLEDFEPFTGSSGDDIMKNGLLNTIGVISKTKEVEDIELSKDGNNYTLSFETKDLDELLTKLNNNKKNTILKMDSSSVSFSLSMDNYNELKDVIPLLNDKNFEVYGPEYSYGMSEDEYKEMISYLLGSEAVVSLEKSYVTISFSTPSTIKEYKNITKTGNNTVEYKFPIIDFLLLNKCIEFSFSW